MMWVLTAVDRREVIRRARYLRIKAPLRQAMIYSNVGYTVAGEAMARAAHTSFESLLRDLVIRPLGLTSTTWMYEQAARMSNVASPHATLDGRQQPIRRETQRDATAPAGAVQSTARDLARWMRFHLNGGVLDGVRYVSDSALRETHVVQVPIVTTAAMRAARSVQDSAGVGYGMGWQVMDYRGHPMIWHTGNGDGQIAYVALLPRDRLGVVVMVNTWSAPFVHGALVSRILDAYLGYEPRDWVGEARERAKRAEAVQDSAYREEDARRKKAPPPLPLASYAGRYEESLFGPVIVRAERTGLTLQMGRGQIADLESRGENEFVLRWRDPLYRENFGAPVYFKGSGRSIDTLDATINRDAFTATRKR
jgi:CubicO group peptidase (beta-lactamase class C family)